MDLTFDDALTVQPQRPIIATVHVAIYSPIEEEDDDLRHWAIWINCGPSEDSVILQIKDNMYGYGFILADPIYARPHDSRRFERSIECGFILIDNLNLVIEAISDHPVRNRALDWNCQKWTIECLELLERRRLMVPLQLWRSRLEPWTGW
ncbi:hypothetical protein N7456_012310 [Penicillium angulare]|uniref:Uncharacterized protein n=1 Tax=Penicillium angulare TaxID=116970 RepID=A0A9W9K0J4_9EURO|nr:hypothetical protein N7456_012310 [Penicillium angulare]